MILPTHAQRGLAHTYALPAVLAMLTLANLTAFAADHPNEGAPLPNPQAFLAAAAGQAGAGAGVNPEAVAMMDLGMDLAALHLEDYEPGLTAAEVSELVYLALQYAMGADEVVELMETISVAYRNNALAAGFMDVDAAEAGGIGQLPEFQAAYQHLTNVFRASVQECMAENARDWRGRDWTDRPDVLEAIWLEGENFYYDLANIEAWMVGQMREADWEEGFANPFGRMLELVANP